MSVSTDQRHDQSTRPVGGTNVDVPTVRVRLTKAVLANVVLLTMIAPLATDMYVPAFPIVGQDLHTGATEVQLTLTTFFVGMATAGVIAPIAGLGGERTAVPMAVIVLVLVAASATALRVLAHPSNIPAGRTGRDSQIERKEEPCEPS